MNPKKLSDLGWSWVRVPHAVYAAPLSGTDALVWVILARYIHPEDDGPGATYVSRERVMTDLGRLGRRPDVVTTATKRLSEARNEQGLPLIRKQSNYRGGKTRLTYRFPVSQLDPFEGLEHQALDLLQRNLVAPEDLLWLLRWRHECRSTEQTERTQHEMAELYGAAGCTVKRHYRTLVRLGLLHSRPRPGLSNLTVLPSPRALQQVYDAADWGTSPWDSDVPWTG